MFMTDMGDVDQIDRLDLHEQIRKLREKLMENSSSSLSG